MNRASEKLLADLAKGLNAVLSTNLFGAKALEQPTSEFARRLDLGLCIDCGEEAHGFVRCIGCATEPNP